MTDPIPPAEAASPPPRFRRWRRWVIVAALALFFFFVLRQVLDPYGDDEYLEVPHGNHSHFVPRDRDPDVSVGAFPTQRPGPNERILPDGRVVPK